MILEKLVPVAVNFFSVSTVEIYFFFAKSLKMFEWLLTDINALDLQLYHSNIIFQKAKIASQAE